MRKFTVYDTTGTYVKSFHSYDAAKTFCIMNGRTDWRIYKTLSIYDRYMAPEQ